MATTASIWSRYHTSCKKHISRVRNRPTGRHRPANDILQRPAGMMKSAETLQVTGLQVAPHRNGGVLLASIGTGRQNDCSRQNELPISQPHIYRIVKPPAFILLFSSTLSESSRRRWGGAGRASVTPAQRRAIVFCCCRRGCIALSSLSASSAWRPRSSTRRRRACQ